MEITRSRHDYHSLALASFRVSPDQAIAGFFERLIGSLACGRCKQIGLQLETPVRNEGFSSPSLFSAHRVRRLLAKTLLIAKKEKKHTDQRHIIIVNKSTVLSSLLSRMGSYRTCDLFVKTWKCVHCITERMIQREELEGRAPYQVANY